MGKKKNVDSKHNQAKNKILHERINIEMINLRNALKIHFDSFSATVEKYKESKEGTSKIP